MEEMISGRKEITEESAIESYGNDWLKGFRGELVGNDYIYMKSYVSQ